jgi:hypothetical protein
VSGGNGVKATREAFAQLLMYQRFLYERWEEVRLVALFNEDIGVLCVNFLEEFGIASVWKHSGGWMGSPIASQAGLCHIAVPEENIVAS